MSVLSSETIEARQKWNTIFTETKKGSSPLYLERNIFQNESKLKTFSYIQNLRDFVASRHTTKDMLGELFGNNTTRKLGSIGSNKLTENSNVSKYNFFFS